jgi:malonyl-CoA/methylmalonyl-CoA synthetase
MAGHFVNDLRLAFQEHRSRPALVYRGQTMTYGEVDGMVCRCAGWFEGLGVNEGDRVALFTPNKLPFLIAHLGALYAGAVALPLNPNFTREEMRFFLADSGARVVVAGKNERALLTELAAELPEPPVVVGDAVALEPPRGPAFQEPVPRTDSACLILYSSGTTGWPKGVVHTNANVASSLAALAACWRMTPEDVVVNVLPLYHIHGLVFATYLTLFTGACLLLEDSFDPQRTLEAMGRSTVFMGVPPIYYRLLDEPTFLSAATEWQNVRLFTCGSAPIRPEVLPELEKILGRHVINRYGMTEAHVITSLPLDGPWPWGSVGRPLAGIELRVIGEDGAAAAPGQVGSVQIRGPNLFREYWNNPSATKDAFKEGWFDTGDFGLNENAGFLTLVGRKHDLIITSGYNVYPQVVERVTGECPGVRECAVVGLPDRQRGERVAAVIVRSDRNLDEKMLMAWWADRLVHYQRPKELVFAESLPRNNLGKVSRRELRKLFSFEGEPSN